MIKDSTDMMSIIIFESLIERISEGSCYDMTKMRVKGYLDKRILKTTITSKVFSNNDRYQQTIMMMFTFLLMRPRVWSFSFKYSTESHCLQAN